MAEREHAGGRRAPNFVGSFRHAVDAQGRIQLPKPIRRAMPLETQRTLIITRGLDGCLTAFTIQGWRAYHEEWARAVGDAGARVERHRLRMVTAHASEVQIDAQGRVSVSADLLATVGIESEVLVVGALDRIEFWNPNVFAQIMAEMEDTFGVDAGGLGYWTDDGADTDEG